MSDLLTFDDARARMFADVELLPGMEVLIDAGLSGWVAESVCARMDLPRFDCSAVDGWAVRSSDFKKSQGLGGSALGASEYLSEKVLRISEALPAGTPPPEIPILAGEAWRVFTGSSLPKGADAVVPQEDCRLLDNPVGKVAILAGIRPWENVRLQGETVAAGKLLVNAGERLRVGHLPLLHATGCRHAKVRRSPQVTLLPTGSEVVAGGGLLGPAQIPESACAALATWIRAEHADVIVREPVMDSRECVREAMQKCLEQDSPDLIVTVGGVSVGDHDWVRPAWEDCGGEALLWRVAMRPGKPLFWGRLGRCRLLGLPGNPVSAWVGAFLFLLPLLRRMQGASNPDPVEWDGILGEPLVNGGDREHFHRVRQFPDGRVMSTGTQASHSLDSLARANGVVRLKPGERLTTNDRVKVMRWDVAPE